MSPDDLRTNRISGSVAYRARPMRQSGSETEDAGSLPAGSDASRIIAAETAAGCRPTSFRNNAARDELDRNRALG